MISDFISSLIQKVSFIKKYRFYDFFKQIIYPFLIKNISKLWKDEIDENLIIMGAHYGAAYLDNPKYLFEYLNKNSDYKLIWIAKFRDVAVTIRKKGYLVVPFFSFKTIKLLRKARYIFISHGIEDILPIKFSPETTIILTWHGTPIKIIDKDFGKSYIYSKWNDIFRLKLKHDQYIDYLLTPSGNKQERVILSKSFKVSPKKILSLGYPKLDLLFNQDHRFIINLKEKYEIPKNIKKVFLYCPTWRDDFKLNIPFTSSDLQILNELLEETATLFLIKAHMLVKKMNVEDYQNIRIVPKNANIEELYLITDVLITDYSSTMLDFSLLNRPILLYPYDLEKYIKDWGLLYDLEEIAPGPIFYNTSDLINGIKNIEKIDKEYKDKRIKVRNRFNKYIDGKSTERILNFLGIKYK